MNSKQRVQAALERKPVDRVPVYMWFHPATADRFAELLEIPQSPLSQHLSRMRKERLVDTRREAQTIFYSLKSGEASRIVEVLYELFCAPEGCVR